MLQTLQTALMTSGHPGEVVYEGAVKGHRATITLRRTDNELAFQGHAVEPLPGSHRAEEWDFELATVFIRGCESENTLARDIRMILDSSKWGYLFI